MAEFLNTPLFGIVISIIAFQIGVWINKKTKLSICNPLIIAIILVIVFLISFDIDYDTYNIGGSMISFLLGPATVILAVPLYKQIDKLKEDGLPIIVGIVVGSLTSMLSVFLLCKLFGLDEVLTLSLMPKSATSAISMEISDQVGGIPALTVSAAVFTGIIGNIVGPHVYKLFKVKDEVAEGVGLGTAAHSAGTAKAMELGEVQGAMSSLAIGVAGIVSVFLMPWLVKILF
jgi:predicted murein hydrolase (TIGR00659 family)